MKRPPKQEPSSYYPSGPNHAQTGDTAILERRPGFPFGIAWWGEVSTVQVYKLLLFLRDFQNNHLSLCLYLVKNPFNHWEFSDVGAINIESIDIKAEVMCMTDTTRTALVCKCQLVRSTQVAAAYLCAERSKRSLQTLLLHKHKIQVHLVRNLMFIFRHQTNINSGSLGGDDYDV